VNAGTPDAEAMVKGVRTMTNARRLSALLFSAVLFTLPALAQAAPPRQATHTQEHTQKAPNQAKEHKHAKNHVAAPPVSGKPAVQPHGGKSPR
jgi:hypothetical protein